MGQVAIRRLKLWSRYPFCYVCQERISHPAECTIEHVLPLSHGGTNQRYNLSISHYECNTLRGNIVCRLEWQDKILRYRSENEDELLMKGIMKSLNTNTASITTSQKLTDKVRPQHIMKAWSERWSSRLESNL